MTVDAHMKILLINPSCAVDEGRDLYTNDVAAALFTMQPLKTVTLGMPLALPTLAAHTPSHHEIKIIDEEIEAIDFDEPADLVGITAMSFKAKRAYEIAHEFRKRGVKVVMGGIHASMCPDEAGQYVDCVVIGEAEELWETVISDTQSGTLKAFYKAERFPDLEQSKIPRYDLVKNKRYVYTYLQTTRGCPHNCRFCTVTKQNGRKIRKKRPEQVIAELDTLLKLRPKRELTLFDSRLGRNRRLVGNIAFIDDNFAIDRNHALAMCAALKKYQDDNECIIGWYTQVNISVGFDSELVKAMADSNCLHLFIGVESIDPETLKKMNKQMNSPERYGEAIRTIQSHGIRVIASTIIGEEGTSWKNTMALHSFLEENNVLHILVNILTPYPGTEIHREFSEEQRIFTYNPQKYNIRNVVFKPKNISKEQLEEMYVWLCRSLFNYRASYRRGRPLLKFNGHLRLPFYMRLPLLIGTFLSLVVLILRGRIRFRAAAWSFWKIPSLVLFNGSFYGIELFSMCLDYDDFAHREERRFINEGVRLETRDDLLSIADQIVPAKSSYGKDYKALYLDGVTLQKFGFSVCDENMSSPVLLLGGTSIPVSDRKRLIRSLLEAGYEVASIENPIGGPLDFMIDPVTERPNSLRDYLGYLRDSCQVREINIIAQSYSAFELVRVLMEDPSRYIGFVKCIILVNPPGFDENLNMARHIIRFLWGHVISGYINPESSHPDKIGFRKKERAGILTWAGKSMVNMVRSLREVNDIVHFRIKEPLKKLQERGFKICFFLQSEDRVVPARITLKHVGEFIPRSQIKWVTGGHNDLFFQAWQRKALIDFYQEVTKGSEASG
jgi:radical SAM superfamily enzyme YgiQ (UPF0313 family)